MDIEIQIKTLPNQPGVYQYFDKNDVIIDGGNSHYMDTQRREIALKKHGINYVGCGVSGGEIGAREGASLMFGGSKEAYNVLKPILNAISAKDNSGKPCQLYVGADGAGQRHFLGSAGAHDRIGAHAHFGHAVEVARHSGHFGRAQGFKARLFQRIPDVPRQP